MRLIDEIEEAARQYHDKPKHTTLTERRAAMLVGGPYWLRIKAALEAGEALVKEVGDDSCVAGEHGACKVCAIIARFRTAFGEGA